MMKRLQRIGRIVPGSNTAMEAEIPAVPLPRAGARLSGAY
jgi:maleate cis-trans isomerase